MRDHDLHSRFDQWLKTSAAAGRNTIRVLKGSYAKARLRYVDGAIHIAVVTVKRKHQRQGVWTSFLEHCEQTGRGIVVECVEDDFLQRFMERRPGYAKEDTTDGFGPSYRARPPGERGGQIPAGVALPGLGGSGRALSLVDLLPRATSVASLESIVSDGPLAKSKVHAPGVLGLPSGAPKSARISFAQTLEAHRCASEGVRLINEGRPSGAIALLKRSVKIHPGVAAGHYYLGVALMAAGRLEQAAEPFAAALRLDPGLASAHHYLAYILDSLGQEEKALASYQAAVALTPDLVDAQARLGELYLARHLNTEAAAAFRAVAAAAPGTAMGRTAEARALEASGAFDEALAATRAILEAHPDNANAHGMLGKLLGEAGLLAEAAAHHLRAAELAPDMGAAWSGVATTRRFSADDGPLIARMNAALAGPTMPPRHRRSLCFALGKAYDDMGDYESAMRSFEAGNRLRARGGRLDRSALARRISRLIEATPPGYLDRQPDLGVEDATPALIVGMPRSGTTLTEQILSSHPEVAAGGELEFWRASDPRSEDFVIPSTAEATRRLAHHYLATLRAIGPEATRVTDKSVDNFMLLGVLRCIFPNATLIHCRRHPVDTALSIFTTNFAANFDFISDRSDLVFYFRQYQRLMAHWRAVLPSDRFVEIDYEALVADPEPQSRRLVAACGLEWDDACLAPHLNTRKVTTASIWQARQPIYRSSVERWRRYEPWLGELRELAPGA